MLQTGRVVCAALRGEVAYAEQTALQHRAPAGTSRWQQASAGQLVQLP